MSQTNNRKKVEESFGDKAKNHAKRALAGAQMAGSMVFSMSVHSYFLWSSLCFFTCALTLTIGGPQVESFMCNKRPQYDLGGLGCDNCSAELIACKKNLCYRNVVNLTWKTEASSPDHTLYNPFTEAVTDAACTDLFRSKATNPIQMIVAIAASTDALTGGCTAYHCGILKHALGAGTLTDLTSPSGQCTNKFLTRSVGDSATCPCGDLIKSPELTAAADKIRKKCGVWLNTLCPYGTFTGSWCPAPPPGAVTTAAAAAAATTAAAVPSATGASFRRLEFPCHAEGGLPSNATTCRQLQNGRQLQDPAPAPAPNLNNELPEFTVGEYGKCTCYQQCTPGLKRRSVKCMAAACKKPAPTSSDACWCDHCANCNTVFPMYVLSIIYFAQGGVAVICFFCYLHAATSEDEQFIRISYLELLGGLASKNLPPLVRISMLVTFGFTFYILIQTWIPKLVDSYWMSDCYDSTVLRLVTIITGSVWVFQVLIARFAKRMARKPPWLFTPERGNLPTPLKQIAQFFSGLGP